MTRRPPATACSAGRRANATWSRSRREGEGTPADQELRAGITGCGGEAAREAITLRSTLRVRETLAQSSAERAQLDEWLGRIADEA